MAELDFDFLRYAKGATNTELHDMDSRDRDPMNGGPFALGANLPITINGELGEAPPDMNILQRYYSNEFIDTVPEKVWEAFHELAWLVGNTPLTEMEGKPGLWLKEEGLNQAAQSFKDRGSLSAALFSLAKHGYDQPVTLGTVSLGNMAISTVYTTDWLCQRGIDIDSFVAISSSIDPVRREAILRSGELGTTIFNVSGQYSQIHDQVYAATRKLRSMGQYNYGMLTDDVFRVAGYPTMFFEVIEQMIERTGKLPDMILVPSASGACARAADFAITKLHRDGRIASRPQIVIVQEQGADPITQAANARSVTCPEIEVTGTPISAAIAVSRARSGDDCLNMIRRGIARAISVSADDIRHADADLRKLGKNYETGSAAAVAAYNLLMNTGQIEDGMQVAAILSGLDEPDRPLMNNPASTQNKLIDTDLGNLQAEIIWHYSTQR